MKFVAKALLLPLCLGMLFSSIAAQAQVQVSIGVNAPVWGPTVGPGVQYYYIPEIDGYYDLYTQSYVYFDNGYWVSSPMLPPWYANYNPRYFHPVVVQYVGRQPWGYIRDHRAYYPQAVAGPNRYVTPGRQVTPGPGRPVPSRYTSNQPGPNRQLTSNGRPDNYANQGGRGSIRPNDNGNRGYAENRERGNGNNRGGERSAGGRGRF